MTLLLLAALLGVLPGAHAAAGAPDVPARGGRVVDVVGVLTARDIEALEAQLAALESARGAQVVVLIVPTTGEDGPERYTARVLETWKLGRPGRDDGVLILIARDDRRARIEAGAGLAATLPEDAVTRILLEELAPRLRDGAYAGGLQATVAVIGRLIGGEVLPPAPVEIDPAPEVDPEVLVMIAGAAAGIGVALHFFFSPLLAGVLTVAPMGIVALWLPGEVGFVGVLAVSAWFLAFVVHRVIMRGLGRGRGTAARGRGRKRGKR